MGTYSNDDLYGCSFEDYCKGLGTTPDAHIERLWKEIDLLQANYDRLLEQRGRMDIAMLCRAINEKIHTKRKTIAKLTKWRNKK